MEKESKLAHKEHFMKENFKMDYSMDLESISLKVALDMKEIINIVSFRA
jgi:predicted kinase